MNKSKTLEEMLRESGFCYDEKIEKDMTLYIVDIVRKWASLQPTRAMYMFEDGLTQHLISKRSLLDSLNSKKEPIDSIRSTKK